MKLLAVGALALGLAAVPMAASAASSTIECTGAACKPFNKDNSYVLQLAVASAQQSSAQVGEYVTVIFYPPPGGLCEERNITFRINRTPVYNSSQLTYTESLCVVNNPHL